MNLSIVHLLFWAFLVWAGWWARGRYGAQVGQFVAPISTDPEELAVLKIYRDQRAADEAAAAKKREDEFRAKLAGQFQVLKAGQ